MKKYYFLILFLSINLSFSQGYLRPTDESVSDFESYYLDLLMIFQFVKVLKNMFHLLVAKEILALALMGNNIL